jgi:hypothetical protein
MNIDRNKIIIFTICIILMLSGFTLILHFTPKTNHINSTLQEGIFKINNNNILKLTYNNTTIYMYDNNLTVIKNISNLENNYNSQILVNTDTTGVTFYNIYTDIISNIPNYQMPINNLYPRASGITNLIKAYLTSANTSAPFNNTLLLPITYNNIDYADVSIGIDVSNYNGLVNIQLLNTALYYFYTASGTTNTFLVSALYYNSSSNNANHYEPLDLSQLFYNNIGNLSQILSYVTFGIPINEFILTIYNYLTEGNLTLTNTTGYYNYINLKTGQAQSLILKNGSYSYSFSYIKLNTTQYKNGTFNITGNSYNLILNTGIGNLLIEYFSAFFLIINILTLAIIYYISRNYYLLIPNQMLFFVIGYEYAIQYYSFYFVMLSVFILSLFIAQKVMAKLTGSVIENEI